MSQLLVPEPDNRVKSAPSSPQFRKSEHHTFSFHHHKKSDPGKNGKKSEHHHSKKSGHKSSESSVQSLSPDSNLSSKTLLVNEVPGLKKSHSTGNGLNKLINKFITPQMKSGENNMGGNISMDRRLVFIQNGMAHVMSSNPSGREHFVLTVWFGGGDAGVEIKMSPPCRE
ncbi:hypothetical protein Btru_067367 [Bulinus truncatus]|nr:hypothetical protein Btru_067367 [Bulinus truncatus]